MFIDEGNSPPI
jgi:cytochrome bd-type quinol oxidase subunit 2